MTANLSSPGTNVLTEGFIPNQTLSVLQSHAPMKKKHIFTYPLWAKTLGSISPINYEYRRVNTSDLSVVHSTHTSIFNKQHKLAKRDCRHGAVLSRPCLAY